MIASTLALESEGQSCDILRSVLESWRADPVLFDRDVHPTHARDFQPEILQAVATCRYTAVKVARGGGKSNGAARAALWFFTTHPDSRVFIVCPLHSQAENFWREVQSLWQSSKLPALFPTFEMLSSELRGASPTHRMTIQSAETGERLESAHARGGVFVIVDEAKQISDAVWSSVQGMLIGPDSRALAVSTAGLPIGFFARAWAMDREKWNRLISVRGDEVPHLKEKTEEMRARLGEHDPVYRAQYLSEFTGATESPFFDLAKIESALGRELQQEGGPVVFGLDVARHGRDETVLAVREGGRVLRFASWGGRDTMETVGRVVSEIRSANPHPEAVVCDGVGVGGGVVDRLREVLQETGIARYVQTVDFIAGAASPKDSEHFANWKTFAAHALLSKLDRGEVSLPNHARLISDLVSYQRGILSSGKQKISDNPARSPDFGDAVILAFAFDAIGQEWATWRPAWLGY